VPAAPDRYRTDADRLNWYQHFNLTPTPPGLINEELRDGGSLETTDIPGVLGTPVQTDCETGVALYRLVQLWGTPNVPGRTAGAMELQRDLTSWQYLFDVEYDRRPEDDPDVPGSFRLSVYDYKTDVSVGLSGFGEGADGEWAIKEPQESAVASVSLPPEPFLEGVVALAINMVDEAVPATFKELWV
jgi:hypothetical protein